MYLDVAGKSSLSFTRFSSIYAIEKMFLDLENRENVFVEEGNEIKKLFVVLAKKRNSYGVVSTGESGRGKWKKDNTRWV